MENSVGDARKISDSAPQTLQERWGLRRGASYYRAVNGKDDFYNIIRDLYHTERFHEEFAGLGILTRIFPQQVKTQYGLAGAEIAWLTAIPYKDEICLPPGNCAAISAHVKDNLDNERFYVIDGIEYLASRNDFQKTLNLKNYLRDYARNTKKGALLFYVDLEAFDKQERESLKNGLEVFPF